MFLKLAVALGGSILEDFKVSNVNFLELGPIATEVVVCILKNVCFKGCSV